MPLSLEMSRFQTELPCTASSTHAPLESDRANLLVVHTGLLVMSLMRSSSVLRRL